jgi:hypothetical protein
MDILQNLKTIYIQSIIDQLFQKKENLIKIFNYEQVYLEKHGLIIKEIE